MTVTLPDAATAALLAQAADRVPVRGPDGTLIGFFDPLPQFEMSDEEVTRMINDPNTKWCTPDEVTARLRSLDGQG
ncbi:MAG: hypothetical protein U0871_17670 [Gemmataceae bacterium]